MNAGADAPDWQRRERCSVWHPYAPLIGAAPPLAVRSAQGVHIELVDGRELIDGMASWWCMLHGYRHPALDESVRRQLEQVAHVMFGGLTHEPAAELAQSLLDLAPSGMRRVFFCDSGSVSVEVAIKMAVQYWQALGRARKNRLATVRGGYHGDTLAAMSVCDPDTGMHRHFGGFVPEQFFAPRPEPAFGQACEDRHAAGLERLLERHRDELAALILEPIVQGAGGMRFYSAGYLKRARALCDAHGVLLIADEIATGFGRSGRMFACEHAGVSPDIMCAGKALSGGYLSFAATLCREEIGAAIDHGPSGALLHGPTFMANPLACAVSLANLRLLESGDWREDVARIERGFEAGLAPLRGEPGVVDVRVLGGIGVVELRESPDPARLQRAALSRGVWLRPFGRLVYAMPPYIISEPQMDQLTEAMRVAVRGETAQQAARVEPQ